MRALPRLSWLGPFGTGALRLAGLGLAAFGLTALGFVTAARGEPVPEVVDWLRRYVEIDTTNPPGNEAEAARFLAAILENEDIPARLLESPGGRTSLYARLPATVPRTGEGVDRDVLVLLHHLDVVPAGEGWQVPPFSGRIHRGKLWGRGAIDVKSLGIAQLAAMVRLAREDGERHRDVVLLGVADEETGGAEGVGWLLDGHPELFADVEAVLGEGGANRVILERLAFWGIEVHQKRPLWLEITARGRGGHGSAPIRDSAVHTLIEGLARLVARPWVPRVGPVARRYLGAMAEIEGGTLATFDTRLDEILASGEATSTLPPSWLAVLVDSVQVTRLEGAASINVIAPEARAWIDVRLLPDTDADVFLAELRETLGPGIEVTVLLAAPPAAPSPIDQPFYRTLESVLSVRAPVVPALIAGVTDARYFRQRGIPAYGFNPFTLEPQDMRGIHGLDEAIPVAELLRGVEVMTRVVRAYVAE